MQDTWVQSWVGKIPCRRECLPPPIFLPGQSHGQRSLVGYIPWGHKESDTTERLNNNDFTASEKNCSWGGVSRMLSVRYLVWFFKNTHNKYMSSSFRLPETDSHFFWLWLFIDAGLQETGGKTLQSSQNLNHHILLRGAPYVLHRVNRIYSLYFFLLWSSTQMFDTFLFYNGVASMGLPHHVIMEKVF